MDQVTTVIAQAIKDQGGNKSEIARRLGKSYSSQQLGQYESGQKQPKLLFYFRWKAVFKVDLLKMIETNVSNDEEENAPVGAEDAERGLSDDHWRDKYIQGLEDDKGWFKEVFRSNLIFLREDVRAISARQKGTGDVVLNSLERLEKKKKDDLVKEADKRILQIDIEAHRPDNADVPRR